MLLCECLWSLMVVFVDCLMRRCCWRHRLSVWSDVAAVLVVVVVVVVVGLESRSLIWMQLLLALSCGRVFPRGKNCFKFGRQLALERLKKIDEQPARDPFFTRMSSEHNCLKKKLVDIFSVENPEGFLNWFLKLLLLKRPQK